MKILHLLKGKETAGIRTYVITVAREIKNRGFDICFALMHKGELYFSLRAEGFKVYHLKKTSTLDLTIIYKLSRLVNHERFDIIHTHNVTSNFYGRIASIFCPNTCVITTVHANIYQEHLSTLNSRALSLLIKKIDSNMAIFSQMMLPISDYIGAILVENGIKPGKIVTVKSGLNLSQEQPTVFKDDIDFRKELKINEEDRIIAIIGRLVPLKNHTMFIDAAKRVVGRERNVTFLIVGDGILLPMLKQYVNDKGLTKHIKFTGWLDDVEQLYKQLSICVICSHSEGFGLTVLEAMRHSVPVIGTKVGALPEIIIHGDTGILTEPGDPDELADRIVYLLKRPDICRQLATAARKNLKNQFSVEKTAKSICAVYIMTQSN